VTVTPVAKATPTMSTSLSGGGKNGANISVPTGTQVRDTAALNGATATAGGTITYTVYRNRACTAVFQNATPSPNTVTNGAVPQSSAVTFNTAGTYYWKAVYSGDAGNEGATSPCTAEVLTVTGRATRSPLDRVVRAIAYWRAQIPNFPNLLPVGLGDFQVNDAATARAVFDSGNCRSPQAAKVAGCLASELLAAELNVTSGAPACPALANADAFLHDRGYAGPGTPVTMTAAERTTALSLQSALDRFNRGRGCT
jgi:plastocyanin